MSDEERREHQEWVRSWGDPNDTIYLSLAEINNGLEALDELKPLLPANGELAAFLGWHPPSLFSYALMLSQRELEKPSMMAVGVDQFGATLWMDGVFAGMLIMLLMFASNDR